MEDTRKQNSRAKNQWYLYHPTPKVARDRAQACASKAGFPTGGLANLCAAITAVVEVYHMLFLTATVAQDRGQARGQCVVTYANVVPHRQIICGGV